MPTTRAARRAARCLTEVLPADALGLVLYQLPLAHDIAAVAPTCHALCDAAKIASKARPFSSKVVTLLGFNSAVRALAAAPDGRVVAGYTSGDNTVRVWREVTATAVASLSHAPSQGHTREVTAVAVLLAGARFVSASWDRTAKLWTLDGALERTFEVGSYVLSVAALPDGVHFVAGLNNTYLAGPIWLYHVDGTLVHTFKGMKGVGAVDDI